MLIFLLSCTWVLPEELAVELDDEDAAGDGISADEIDKNAVTGNAIADDAVGSDELNDGAVGTDEIENGAVGSDELADTIELGIAGTTSGQLLVNSADESHSVLSLKPFQYGSSDTVGSWVSYFGSSGNVAGVLAIDDVDDLPLLAINGDSSVCCSSGAGFLIDRYGDGNVFASGDKTFVMKHPLEPDKRIVYAAIEGPESAAFIRGTAQLEGGMAFVELPEHFRLVASPTGMSASATPTSADSQGLAVTELTPEYLVIEELFGGTGDYTVYWQVEAKRAGREDFRVIRDAKEYAMKNEPGVSGSR